MSIFDELEALRIKLQAFIVTEESGLLYDHATSWCSDCPEREYSDWRDGNSTICCKDQPDYQEKEIEALESLKTIIRAINESKKHFGDYYDVRIECPKCHAKDYSPKHGCFNCRFTGEDSGGLA